MIILVNSNMITLSRFKLPIFFWNCFSCQSNIMPNWLYKRNYAHPVVVHMTHTHPYTAIEIKLRQRGQGSRILRPLWHQYIHPLEEHICIYSFCHQQVLVKDIHCIIGQDERTDAMYMHALFGFWLPFDIAQNCPSSDVKS